MRENRRGKRGDTESRLKVKEPSTRALRINRIISMAGLASRRGAEGMILEGRIAVNGRIVTEPGAKAFWGKDSITLDGKEIPSREEKIYIMLNKPFGYICSLKDPQGRPLVTDLVTGISQRIYPVGRLDFDSLGLLLLTNDGELTRRLTHPSFGLRRTYKATVPGMISDEALALLERGVLLEDGPSGKAKVTVLKKTPERSVLRITISQGRNRQVRRMLDAVGYEVIQLMRIGFGPLALGDLKIGQFRPLTAEEVASLNKIVGLP
jgi:23S rRNA pseudouridine2605 synthase